MCISVCLCLSRAFYLFAYLPLSLFLNTLAHPPAYSLPTCPSTQPHERQQKGAALSRKHKAAHLAKLLELLVKIKRGFVVAVELHALADLSECFLAVARLVVQLSEEEVPASR